MRPGTAVTPSLHCTDTVAFEAAAALDDYEAELASLASTPPEPLACARLTARMRRVCSRCMRLPQLSVACVALLLSHYRLLGELMRSAGAPPPGLLQSHQACILQLQHQCRELFLARYLH